MRPEKEIREAVDAIQDQIDKWDEMKSDYPDVFLSFIDLRIFELMVKKQIIEWCLGDSSNYEFIGRDKL